mgnify:CR=1 FL=1
MSSGGAAYGSATVTAAVVAQAIKAKKKESDLFHSLNKYRGKRFLKRSVSDYD